jgi:ribosomal protein S27E
MPDEAATKVGARVRCEQCGSEAIIVRAEAPELTCCGAVLTVILSGKSAS